MSDGSLGSAATTPPSACTGVRIRKVARLVSHIFDQHLEPHGLTVTQFGLLGQLKSDDGVGIGMLAERMVMDPTSLTRTLRPLERQGFVRLAHDPRDRRHRRLHLTPEGRAVYEAARPAWLAGQRQIDQALGGTDATTLNALLDRTIERLAR
ncbi:MarR family winged helix-turn-helix transcriptional regulator [Phreatobacter stygius]|nr:MarR family winged helix-turn-helix transcriptional regulator [Phreatobacter stygius]